MPKKSKPRAGSLQVWPRKRARKFLPSVNWAAISDKTGLKGFIAYKVGMISCLIKDNTETSLTKDRRIIVPGTVLELPGMKIFSVRFYKDRRVVKDILNENIDKELKKRVKLPKAGKSKDKIDDVKDYDDVSVIAYSLVRNTGIKKTPDLVEIGLGGSKEEKISFIKENLGKEILGSDILKELNIIDVRGLSKGKGLQGPVRRFGIGLREFKSEKGRRRPGSIGPWHPAHVTFRVPMAGQLGMFTRVKYNSKIISLSKVQERDINPKQGWKDYGKIKSEYVILEGSVPGVKKRQLLLTKSLRATKKQVKKNYELIELR